MEFKTQNKQKTEKNRLKNADLHKLVLNNIMTIYKKHIKYTFN